MKKLIAVMCLSAVMLASCKNTDNKSNSVRPVATTKPPVTDTFTDEVTTGKTETTTDSGEDAAVTSENTATEPVTTQEPDGMVSAGGRMDMYPAVYQSEIRRIFDETSEKNEGSASIEYALRDLDNDGIPELILKYGTCEADYQIHIYRYDEECELKDLGLFGGGHTAFCYDENTGDFVILWGHMGASSIMYYEWENGTLVSKDHYDFTLDDKTPSYDTVLDEKGVKYMEFVAANNFSADGEIKSWIYYGNGNSEEKEGLYLDYIG